MALNNLQMLICHKAQTTNQSTGAVEYVDCISPEVSDSSDVHPGRNTEQSDAKAPVL